MENVLQSVTNAAVWGSLIANVVLGAFMFVQAIVDRPRRSRFGSFALVCGLIAGLDFLHDHFSPLQYEFLRLLAWSGYGTCVVYLFSTSWRAVAAAGLLFPTIGLAVWLGGYPAVATTAAFPAIFGVAAVAHGAQYRRNHGFASAILCAYSAAIALLCAFYFSVISAGNPIGIGLGYAQYAGLSIVSVIFGWVQLPRELRGDAPVTVAQPHAILLLACILSGEAGVVLGLLKYLSWPPVLFLVASTFILGVTLTLSFYHRHLLVIHTDKVAALLEERTVSLRQAQVELSRQNEVQAQKLEAQARELKAKAEVIDRQRRLELAGQTTGQAAHDIQNLITPILAHVSRLQQAGKSPEDVQGIAATLRTQVEHLLDLNGQLLALSRRGRLELSPVDLGELIHEVKARFPGQNVQFEGAPDLWTSGSWSQLSRAVSNLILNAVEATTGRTAPVSVRCLETQVAETRRCHLGFLPPGTYIRVDVQDRGTGIPSEVIDRIFEPFFSSKNGERSSGSGLGLTIVAAIIEDHRGVLDLATGPEGTTFSVYLPRIEAPGGRVDLKALSGNETVAVIDDDSSMLEIYGEMLRQAGYTVRCAESGAKALELLQRERIDLLLLDLKMPQMTGFDTFFGAMHLHPGVQAVIHSSFITSEDVAKLQAMGVAAVLQKPASRREVLKTLRQVFDAAPPVKVKASKAS